MSPEGTESFRHSSSPSYTAPYSFSNIPRSTLFAMASVTSARVGHTSLRKTGFPSLPVPSGSAYGSKSMVPASAYATTSGGDAR